MIVGTNRTTESSWVERRLENLVHSGTFGRDARAPECLQEVIIAGEVNAANPGVIDLRGGAQRVIGSDAEAVGDH